MFKDFTNGMKLGLGIMAISGIIMAVEILLEIQVGDLIMFLFFIGMVVTLISSMILQRKS